MQKLQDIEVRTETPPIHTSHHGNAIPILHEILHAMQRLNNQGKPTVIDLRSIPFGPGDEEQLLKMLGRGEIEVKLDSLGVSDIWESRYHGVWVIEHKNTVDERIALQIEVTHVPEILQSQKMDISDSISRLIDQLDEGADTTGL
ncbi:MAG: hydrogenase expression/formation C-terminal domain-containing protein [Pseudomonadota bacterium]